MPIRKLTTDEEQYLRDNYGKIHNKEMAEYLKVSWMTVYTKLKQLGLGKNAPAQVKEGYFNIDEYAKICL